MFEVEKGIPIPRGIRARRFDFPLSNMDIGDSFLVPLEDGNEKSVSSVRQALYNARKREAADLKLITTVTPDGLRVWRKA